MNTIEVANAVIINKFGQVLLTQRYDPQNKNVHMRWQVPGGKIENNETPWEACIREAKEETGLNIEIISDAPLVINQKYPDRCFRLNVFLARPLSDTIDTSLDMETHDAKWYKLDEIKTLKTIDDTLEMIQKVIRLWKKS